MEVTQLEALEAKFEFQQKQIDALADAVKLLEQRLPSFCSRCKMPIPLPAFGSR